MLSISLVLALVMTSLAALAATFTIVCWVKQGIPDSKTSVVQCAISHFVALMLTSISMFFWIQYWN